MKHTARPPPDRLPRVKSIAALRRGLVVLRTVRRQSEVSLGELHELTRIPKASLLRILKTLDEAGWVQRRVGDGVYMQRVPTEEADPATRHRTRVVEAAAPSLRSLQRKLPWPSDIAIRDGTRMLILESNRPLSAIGINREVVGFHPDMALSAMGRAYLAYCPDSERRELLEALQRAGPRPDHRPERLRAVLEKTRACGYAVRDVRHRGPDAEGSSQFSAIAVPIMAGNRVAACLSCVWLTGVASESAIVATYLGLLQRTAAGIGGRL